MSRLISTALRIRLLHRRCVKRLGHYAGGWMARPAPAWRKIRICPGELEEFSMKLTKTITRLAAAGILLALVFLLPPPARAGRLGADVIALFPKDIGEFAYADLKKARALKWFPQLQEQMLPERFRQFEKFLASAGVDPNTQVEELAWGLVAEYSTSKGEGAASSAVPTGERIVGVALGNYNPDSTEAYFKRQKLPTFQGRNYTLYAFGTGAGPSDLFFLFIDSST